MTTTVLLKDFQTEGQMNSRVQIVSCIIMSSNALKPAFCAFLYCRYIFVKITDKGTIESVFDWDGDHVARTPVLYKD